MCPAQRGTHTHTYTKIPHTHTHTQTDKLTGTEPTACKYTPFSDSAQLKALVARISGACAKQKLSRAWRALVFTGSPKQSRKFEQPPKVTVGCWKQFLQSPYDLALNAKLVDSNLLSWLGE